MKLSIIKKFNIVVSLWLLVVLVALMVFGYELANYGCYIAAAVIGAIIVINNLIVLISGLIIPVVQEKMVSRQYN